jgi:hypothetical protein
LPSLGSRTSTGLSYFNKENEVPAKRSDIFLSISFLLGSFSFDVVSEIQVWRLERDSFYFTAI